MFNSILSGLQIITPIVLIVLVLASSKSAGLSSVFGGDGGFSTLRRGPEKVIFQVTVGVVILFLVVSILSAFFAG